VKSERLNVKSVVIVNLKITDLTSHFSFSKNMIARIRQKLKKLPNKREGILTSIDYKKTRYKVLYLAMFLMLLAMVFITFFPIFWLLMTSFMTDTEIGSLPVRLFPESLNFAHIADTWNTARLGMPFLNSLMIVGGAVLVSVVFNGILGFVLAVIKPKGGKIIFGAIMVGYMIPPITGMVPLFDALTRMGLTDNPLPLMLIFGANAFYLVMFKNYMESLPKAIFEAAEVDGAGMFRVFFRIVIPLSWPIIGVIAIFTATAAWNDFLLPFLLLQDSNRMTVMVRLVEIQANQYSASVLYMSLLIATVPLILLFLIFQRRITSTVTTSGIK